MLFGSFAKALPNAMNFDWDADRLAFAAQPARLRRRAPDAQEVPWSGEQYVCAANRALRGGRRHAEHLRRAQDLSGGQSRQVHLREAAELSGQHFRAGSPSTPSIRTATVARPSSSRPGTRRRRDRAPDRPRFEYLSSIEPLLLGAQSGSTRYPEDADGANAAVPQWRNHTSTASSAFMRWRPTGRAGKLSADGRGDRASPRRR